MTAPTRAGVAPSPVLDLLRPLVSAYMTRADRRPEAPTNCDRAAPEQGTYESCVVESIVRVDGKGRVALGAELSEPGPVAICIDGHLQGALRADGTTRHAIDARGRLLIPHGILRTAGMEPGERVAIIRQPGVAGLVLVAARCLGVRVGRCEP